MQAVRDRQVGFTLTEMLMVIAIGAIVLTAAAAGFDAVVNNSRRATGVNQLVSTMHAARSEAITRNMQVTICPSADGENCTDSGEWQSGWIYFTDPDQTRAPGGDNQVLGRSPSIERLTIGSAEFPSFLVYRPNGRVMGATPGDDNGEFTVCDPRGATEARVIIIGNTGQPQLSETQVDGSAPLCPGA